MVGFRWLEVSFRWLWWGNSLGWAAIWLGTLGSMTGLVIEVGVEGGATEVGVEGGAAAEVGVDG